VLVALAFRVRRLGMSGRAALRLSVADAMAVLGVVLIASATLNPNGAGGRVFRVFPHADLASPVKFMRNVGGNVLLFVPFGIALALRRWRLSTALAVGVLLSTGIEVAQYAWHLGRTSEVADVVLNTLGVGLGHLMGLTAVGRRRAPASAVSAAVGRDDCG
jgi:glycopeptide antibiotics resistance protein